MKIWAPTQEEIADLADIGTAGGYGKLKLEGAKLASSSDAADIALLDVRLSEDDSKGLTPEGLARLVKKANFRRRITVLFDVMGHEMPNYRPRPVDPNVQPPPDEFTRRQGLENVYFIRSDARPSQYLAQAHPRRVIAWPQLVEGCPAAVPVPAGGFSFDLAGSRALAIGGGRLSTLDKIRIYNTSQSTDRITSLRHDIQWQPSWDGVSKLDTVEDGEPYKSAFDHAAQHSVMILAPELHAGIPPRIFYRALSAGRPVLYVHADQKPALPFSDVVRYQEFVCFVHADQIDYGNRFAAEWLKDRQPFGPICAKARAAWDEYLSSAAWSRQLPKVLEQIRLGDVTTV